MGRGKEKPSEKQDVIGETNSTTIGDSWKITGWDSLSSVTQAFIAVILVVVTTWLMWKSNELIESTSQNTVRLTEEIRRLEVQPLLRLGAMRVVNRTRNLDVIVVRISNAGNGSALDLNVILRDSDSGYCKQLIHNFYPTGVFPRYDYLPMLLFWTPVEPELDSMLIRDFIHPGEELEFQYGGPLGLRSIATTLILHLSYFDSDGNEYLTSTSLVPGENTMQITLDDSDHLLDSLDSIGSPSLYEYNTLVNPGLRERGHFWGTEERWLKRDTSGP